MKRKQEVGYLSVFIYCILALGALFLAQEIERVKREPIGNTDRTDFCPVKEKRYEYSTLLKNTEMSTVEQLKLGEPYIRN